jgi:protein O-GlcNAc transferase
MGLLGTAEECFRRASAMNPSDLQSYQLLANVLMASNKHSEAAKAYDDANRLAPDSSALINQGVSLQRAGKFSEAAETYRMAIAIDPTRYEAHHNLAGCLQDMTHPSDAIAHYARATEINPSFAASYSAMVCPAPFPHSLGLLPTSFTVCF